MAIAFFSSLPEGDVVEVEFVEPGGGGVTMQLLVDSGFTGRSAFVLPQTATSIIQSLAPASQASGALHGLQNRVVVTCRVPALLFEKSFVAILADTTALSLPFGVVGLVGLSFLRAFKSWGAEKLPNGDWRFFLSE
jgi:predicted aspartyl protease